MPSHSSGAQMRRSLARRRARARRPHRSPTGSARLRRGRAPSAARRPRGLLDDSPTAAARGSTLTTSVSLWCCSATSTVMSFVIDAIGSRCSACEDASTSPVRASTTRYAFASTDGGPPARAVPANDEQQEQQKRDAFHLHAQLLADEQRRRLDRRVELLDRRDGHARLRRDHREGIPRADRPVTALRLRLPRAVRSSWPSASTGRWWRSPAETSSRRARVRCARAARRPSPRAGTPPGPRSGASRPLPAGGCPDLALEPGGLGARCLAEVAAGLAERVVDRARRVDDRARRPALEGARRSETDAPCAPTPGSSRIACGISLRASPTSRGCVAPTTAPTDDSPPSPTRSAPHSATASATCCHIGRPSRICTSWMSCRRSTSSRSRRHLRRSAARRRGTARPTRGRATG